MCDISKRKGRYIYILYVHKRKNDVVDGTDGGAATKGTEATGIIVKSYTHTRAHTCVALGDVYLYIYAERLTEGGTCRRAHTACAHYAAAFDRIMENRSEATFM